MLLLKKAEQSGKPLADAIFDVYRAFDDVKVGEITTNVDGEATFKLPVGDFYLQETQPPRGFLLEKAKIFFTVNEDSTVTVEVTNQRDENVPEPIDIPKTGETPPYGNYIFAVLSLGVSVACGVILYRGRKIKRKIN